VFPILSIKAAIIATLGVFYLPSYDPIHGHRFPTHAQVVKIHRQIITMLIMREIVAGNASHKDNKLR